MITTSNRNDIEALYDKLSKHEGAYATCRVIDHEAYESQEWAEHCEYDGIPVKVYYIFTNDEANVEDGGDMPWDVEHVSKIEIAEMDDDGDYDTL